MNEKVKPLYEGITNIDDDLIEEAYAYKEKTKPRQIMKRLIAVAACLCLCAGISLPVMAATGNEKAFETLYKVSPAIAQKLKPVNQSSESKGIRMEVESASIEGNEAEILVSFKDLERNRVDESLDLFDSYRINQPHDGTSGCEFHHYDEETGKATFLLSIKYDDGKKIEGEKVTFSVDRLLINKDETKCELSMIDMSALAEATKTYSPQKYGASYDPALEGWDWEEQKVLVPNENNAVEICEGIYFTGAGLVDGVLHIQMKYEDFYNTDNHGFISLKDAKGNIVECKQSVGFTDAQDVDGYNEYLFDLPTEELKDYVVVGEFVSSGGLIHGGWEITFPVEAEMDDSKGE